MEPVTANDIKIAVLEEKISGIREQQKAHAEKTDQSFKVVFTKLEDVLESMNKGKGVFAASLFFAGVIGGAVSKLMTIALNGFK